MKPRDGQQVVAFAWSGLPYYAAAQIGSFLEQNDHPCFVVATKPSKPVDGIVECLGMEPIWVRGEARGLRWQDLNLPVPDVFFQGGHFISAFRDLGDEVKNAKGRVVYLTDAAWTGRLRQRMLDPIRHRIFLRHRFDSVLVPGISGRRLARYLGYDEKAVFEGMLGADPGIFFPDKQIDRKKQIVFAGRLAPEKNIEVLIRAFEKFSQIVEEWTLVICGEGELKKLIPSHPRIISAGFQTPEELADILRVSEAFVMPSKREAWGVAVHEAALSGCALILSNAVGAKDDLLTSGNGLLFDPKSEDDLVKALVEFSEWTKAKREFARTVSVDLAAKFGPQKFAQAAQQIIASF